MNHATLSLRARTSAPALLADRAGGLERQIYVRLASRLLAVAFGLSVIAPSLVAQQNQTTAGSPEAAWSSIQQLVQNLADAVQSKNLRGIHEPSMKIRAPIRTLKQHSNMLAAETSHKMVAVLKQLDTTVTDLHSAADAGDQPGAESSLKALEAAFDQLKALDPDTAFKGMH
jgi:hypothetical protein